VLQLPQPQPQPTPPLNIALHQGPTTIPGRSTAHLQSQQLLLPQVILIPPRSTVPQPGNTTIQGLSIAPLRQASQLQFHQPITPLSIAKSTTNTTTIAHSTARKT
jgi:hypothetical protein